MKIARNSLALTTGLLLVSTGCNRPETTAAPAQDPAAQQNEAPAPMQHPEAPQPSSTADATKEKEQQQAASAKTENAKGNADLLKDAAAVLQKMKADPKLTKLISEASGVFIVPNYGRGAVGVGARGGEGVMLAQQSGKWRDPLFYNIMGLSFGAQLGAEGGNVAMLLMNDQALQRFDSDKSFALNAGAKFTLADYSSLNKAQLAAKGRPAVIFWSDTSGAFAGAALSVTNITWDEDDNRAYYGKQVTAKNVFEGKISDDKESPLKQQLSNL